MIRFVGRLSLFDVFGVLGLLPILAVLLYPLFGVAQRQVAVDTASPIIVDLGGRGYPDILAKADWWRDTDRRPDMDALRPFKMRDIVQQWEWVGPDAGLLVYNPSQDPVLRVTGKELFGNMSFDESAEDGYTAMSRLDSNNSQTLEGDELKDVWVWRDLNSDAVVQLGELQSAKTFGISLLLLSPSTDEPGKFSIPNGCVINGKVAATWDWWPLGIVLSTAVQPVVTRPANCTYVWTAEGSVAHGTFDFQKRLDVLTVLFCPVGSIEAVSVPVTVSGFKLEWSFNKATYKAYLQADGTLMGQTDSLLWKAIPVGLRLVL